jgi:hypothetical protein
MWSMEVTTSFLKRTQQIYRGERKMRRAAHGEGELMLIWRQTKLPKCASPKLESWRMRIMRARQEHRSE